MSPNELKYYNLTQNLHTHQSRAFFLTTLSLFLLTFSILLRLAEMLTLLSIPAEITLEVEQEFGSIFIISNIISYSLFITAILLFFAAIKIFIDRCKTKQEAIELYNKLVKRKGGN